MIYRYKQIMGGISISVPNARLVALAFGRMLLQLTFDLSALLTTYKRGKWDGLVSVKIPHGRMDDGEQ